MQKWYYISTVLALVSNLIVTIKLTKAVKRERIGRRRADKHERGKGSAVAPASAVRTSAGAREKVGGILFFRLCSNSPKWSIALPHFGRGQGLHLEKIGNYLLPQRCPNHENI